MLRCARLSSVSAPTAARALTMDRWRERNHIRVVGEVIRESWVSYVREEKLLTLEKAIQKMTGMPAKRVGLRDRGLLREGMFADITIFDPQTRDRSRNV